MDKVQFLVVGALSLVIAGCSAAKKPVYYEHAQYGLVPTEHAAFVQDRDDCGKGAYAKGITIKGNLVTNRSKAVELYVKDIVNLNIPPGSGAWAGIQGAMAVSGNDPLLVPSTTSRPQTFNEPDYADKFHQLEKETWDCVATKGWKKRV